jgi:hypothetical protein
MQPLVVEQVNAVPGMIDKNFIFNSFGAAADWLEEYLNKNPAPRLRKADIEKDFELDRLKDRQN